MNRSYTAVIVVLIIVAVGAIALSGALSPSNPSGSQSSGSSTSSATSSGSSSAAGGPSGGSQGTFSMLATDPPVYASGVSKIYVQFSGEDLHSVASAAASGWVGLNSTGTVELTSLVNTTQTIASNKIKSGTYDMARLDVTSTTDLYNGKNYTASMPSGQLTASLTSQLKVNSSAPSAAVIDLQTVVINAGNTTKPQFSFSASVKAAVVPSSDVSASVTIGARADFHTQSWWNLLIVKSAASLQITSANMNSGSLDVVVWNNGGASTALQIVTVTPVSALGTVSPGLPPTLTGSATFVVNQDGTLSSSTQASQQALLGGPGMNLAAGASAPLSYKGAIQVGKGGLLTVTGVIQGERCLVTVISSDSAASLVVVAG
jgi:hypothetical protein